MNNLEHSSGCTSHSIAATARLLGVGRTTTHALINRGDLRAIKIGKRRRITSAEIARFLQDAEARAAEDAVA